MGFVQGRGGSQGYDAALALQTRADVDELEKENIKSFTPLEGEVAFSVVKVSLPGSPEICIMTLDPPSQMMLYQLGPWQSVAYVVRSIQGTHKQ